MILQVALAVFICYVVYKVVTEEYRDVPGPTRVPLIGNALSFIRYSHTQLFEAIVNFPKIYGPRFLIKVLDRYIIHLCNVEDIEVVLSHSKNIKKSKPYTLIEPWLGTGLLVSTGSKWHRRRKILTPTFHFDILKNFMRVFEENSKGLVNELKENARNGGNFVDVMPLISDYTLYAICETAMGTQLQSGDSSSKAEYKNAILGIGHVVLTRLVTFYLQNDFLFRNLPIGKKFEQHLGTVHDFTDNVIMVRKKQLEDNDLATTNDDSGRRRLALLDLLLEAEKKGEIDLEGIKEEVNTFMFEGHDTTAIAITFGLMLLADHEEVQEKLLEECQSILGNSKQPPTMADLADMKYLDAVIKEILRLYPSAPFIGRKIDEEFNLGDLKIKPGCEVVVHIYVIQRRPDLFPDPEAFKPERFLSSETRHPYAYIPFSAGPRNCIGQRFAKLEMKCFFSEIIRNFKLQPLKPGARPKIKADLVLRADEPIYVKFIPRL